MAAIRMPTATFPFLISVPMWKSGLALTKIRYVRAMTKADITTMRMKSNRLTTTRVVNMTPPKG